MESGRHFTDFGGDEHSTVNGGEYMVTLRKEVISFVMQ